MRTTLGGGGSAAKVVAAMQRISDASKMMRFMDVDSFVSAAGHPEVRRRREMNVQAAAIDGPWQRRAYFAWRPDQFARHGRFSNCTKRSCLCRDVWRRVSNRRRARRDCFH